jgi:hypothetical protein
MPAKTKTRDRTVTVPEAHGDVNKRRRTASHGKQAEEDDTQLVDPAASVELDEDEKMWVDALATAIETNEAQSKCNPPAGEQLEAAAPPFGGLKVHTQDPPAGAKLKGACSFFTGKPKVMKSSGGTARVRTQALPKVHTPASPEGPALTMAGTPSSGTCEGDPHAGTELKQACPFAVGTDEVHTQDPPAGTEFMQACPSLVGTGEVHTQDPPAGTVLNTASSSSSVALRDPHLGAIDDDTLPFEEGIQDPDPVDARCVAETVPATDPEISVPPSPVATSRSLAIMGASPAISVQSDMSETGLMMRLSSMAEPCECEEDCDEPDPEEPALHGDSPADVQTKPQVIKGSSVDSLVEEDILRKAGT